MLEQLSQWGERLLRMFGEETTLPENSPTLSQMKQFFEHYRLSSLLPYRYYDPKTHLFYNNKSKGFVFEMDPLVGCTEEMQREISGLFQHTLPEKGTIQFLLWADPNLDYFYDNWEQARTQQDNPILKVLAQKRSSFLKEKTYPFSDHLLNQGFRNFRCIISYSEACEGGDTDGTQEKLFLTLQAQMLSSFKMLGSHPRLWEAQDLIEFCDQLLSPGVRKELSARWNRFHPLNEQIGRADVNLTIDQHQIHMNDVAVRCYSVKREPDYWSMYAMGDLIGDNMRDLLRLSVPFFIHYGLEVCDQKRTKTRVQSRESWVENQARSKIGQRIPILVNQSKELDFVRHQLGKGERFVKSSLTVGLFASPSKIAEQQITLLNIFRSKRWHLQSERYLHLPCFLSCLPMNWGEGFSKDLGYMRRLKTTLSTESANLLPIQGEWKGTSSPGMLLVGRRGQVFTWSPFDNNAGNYNVCVVGRSGSGKSVFMQELMTSTLGQGGQVFVLDVGRSFEKTVKLLGGQYIEFTPQADLCINPFSFLPLDDEKEAQDALAMLKPIVSLMASPTTGTSDLENAYIDQALQAAWEEKKRNASITDVADFLTNQEDLIAKNLAQKLFSYTDKGSYGRFFNGPATINFSDRLVVVELEELKERKDLQSVIVQMVILHITNKLYFGDRKTPSHLVLDEAWDMLRGKQSGEFIETAARRLRKYRGSLVVGTQSVNDFYATPGAQAAFDNSDWMCLLSQKKESIAMLKKTSRLAMDPLMEEMLESLKTEQGQYAEVLIYGPHGYAIGRLILDPFSGLLYSTKPEEFSAVQDEVKEGATLLEALERLSRPGDLA